MSSPSSPKRPRIEEAVTEGALGPGDNDKDTVAGALQEVPVEEGDYLEDQEIVDELGLVQSKLEKVRCALCRTVWVRVSRPRQTTTQSSLGQLPQRSKEERIVLLLGCR